MTTAKKIDAKSKLLLSLMAACILIAATTATGLYSYPETLDAASGVFIITHDLAGDIALLLSGVYLMGHLPRTWRMRRMTLSRYSGVFVVFVWLISGITGVYGHFVKLEDHTPLWWLHFVTSMASVIVVCFHGAWAFRPRRLSLTQS